MPAANAAPCPPAIWCAVLDEWKGAIASIECAWSSDWMWEIPGRNRIQKKPHRGRVNLRGGPAMTRERRIQTPMGWKTWMIRRAEETGITHTINTPRQTGIYRDMWQQHRTSGCGRSTETGCTQMMVPTCTLEDCWWQAWCWNLAILL